MIKLKDIRLSDIASDRIKIPEVLALFAALDPEMQEITRAIDEAAILSRIDELPEPVVDLLSWQFHVDFYESLGLNLEKKRALVKNSLKWHRHKGTKYAVEDIVRTLFYENFRIEEWFEYGGAPFFFRARMGTTPLDEADLEEIYLAIETTKNERSWLDYIVFHDVIEPKTLHIAAVLTDESICEIFSGAMVPEKVSMTQYKAGAVDEYITEIFCAGTPQKVSAKVQPASTFDEYVREEF